MGPHAGTVRGGETQCNTKIPGVDRFPNNARSMEVMVTSYKEAEELPSEDDGCWWLWG